MHRQLGIPGGPLTYEILEEAVTAAVTETSDLDWKKHLPSLKDPGWKAELAKDVAAQANSAGGMIVFGVEEDPVTTAAAGLRRDALDAPTRQPVVGREHIT